MVDKLSDLELKSTRNVKIFIGDVLQLLAAHFHGETTINQLRIGHYIGLMSLYNRTATSNKDISKELGIPRSTVSRIVADYVKKGWVHEQPDPEDGRRKQIIIPLGHPLADNYEKEFRKRLNDLIHQHNTENFVLVDPEKDGF